jgi:hypothetical protein
MSKKQRKTDPCDCGSGEQFRYCHGAAAETDDTNPMETKNPRRVFMMVVMVLSPIAIIAGLSQGDPEDTVNRVWSSEHGHYHTLDGGEIGAAPAPAPEPAAAAVVGADDDGAPAVADPPAVLSPPRGAPPGKVWDPEHGHFHDIDGGAASPGELPAIGERPWDHNYTIHRPEGEAPEGQVWSESHGHWHPTDGA